MAFFDRIFGRGRPAAQARTAELRGDLQKATELFGEAGMKDEVARVMVLRGDSETEARARLQLYAQASHVAPAGTPIQSEARKKRAELLLALAGDATVSAVARHEVLEAARDLEAIGEPLRAAEAFARAGDKEGEARALQAAGDVERLEFLLSMEQSQERISRARDDHAKDVDLLLSAGRRREALALLEQLLAETPDDASVRERANGLRSRKVAAPIVVLEALGERWPIVLGNEIVIGRSEGAIRVSSNAVSRQHLRIFREKDAVLVQDLETRNGTQMRGINLAGAIAIGEGLSLKLGREVPFRVAPCAKMTGAVEIHVAGDRYVAALGPTRTPIGDLELGVGADGWVELVSSAARPAYAGSVELHPRTTLLVGDAIATTRGAEPVLRVHGV